MLMAILLAYSTYDITSGKKKYLHIVYTQLLIFLTVKCQNIKHNFDLTSDMPRPSQFMPEKVIFHGEDVINDATV